MTNLLIIEDDPMVQFIHRNYLEKIGGFSTIFSSETIKEAKHLLHTKDIQLVLLDIHLRDGHGLDFLTYLRAQSFLAEVILITAATETQLVQQSLHFGILDYLIKPFTFNRFEQSIQKYWQKERSLIHSQVDQQKIDSLFQQPTVVRITDTLEKGLTSDTLNLVLTQVKKLKQAFTVQEAAQASGLSHVSVRKYLNYLEKIDSVRSETVYLKAGRPYKVYRVHDF